MSIVSVTQLSGSDLARLGNNLPRPKRCRPVSPINDERPRQLAGVYSSFGRLGAALARPVSRP